MKTLSRKRSVRADFETLENRRMLSATVLSQIPAQTVTVGQAAGTVTLSSFLADPQITGGTVIKMATPLGNFFLQLTNSATPNTVANFVQYINNGEYVPTIIQRSVPDFVLQGGGTKPDGSNNQPVSTLNSEAGISNTIGTIAMALSTGPNSGTNQWFINLADNSSELDGTIDGGPFTVFGNVIDNGMNVVNAIANLGIIDGSAENFNWSTLPVINYSGISTPSSVPQSNLVTDTVSVATAKKLTPKYSAVSANPNLVTASVSNGVLTLTPAAGVTSGSTTVTASFTDLGGETVSSTFTVNVAGLTPANVAFTQGPTNVKAGHAISPAITVEITDASGDPINGIKARLAIASGPAGAVLDGTLKATTVNGVATFSNVSITEAGTYTLVATHGSLTSPQSADFTVKHTMATKLGFFGEPSATTAGTVIAPPIEVEVLDQYDNVVTNNASGVTLKIVAGSGAAGAILGGTLTELADSGVATFSDITISESGLYQLKAVDGSLTKAKSVIFNIV
jgi:peptidyl-prolyl cis-trans isomerase A (cyclophilin A)